MQDNDVLSQSKEHTNFTEDQIHRAIEEVRALTGFEPGQEVQRRFFYDPEHTWRVRVSGTFEGAPALLRLENLALHTDEEQIRKAFRAVANDIIRPPQTYACAPFDHTKGYAWSIDEDVGEKVLFDPAGDPVMASQKFLPFYDALRLTVRTAFTQPPDIDAEAFSAEQLRKWMDLARERNSDAVGRHTMLLARISEAILARMTSRSLQYMHAHLSGTDVRVLPDGGYVVFANHFWSWRQPCYDVAFTIWSQWMSLPAHRRTPAGISHVTQTWMENLSSTMQMHPDPGDNDGSDSPIWLDATDLRVMLLNRCFGSLVLDIPAKARREPPVSVKALEVSIVAEAERLLRSL